MKSDTLQYTNVPVVEQDDCVQMYAEQEMEIYDTNICAGYEEGGKDACQVRRFPIFRRFLYKLLHIIVKELNVYMVFYYTTNRETLEDLWCAKSTINSPFLALYLGEMVAVGQERQGSTCASSRSWIGLRSPGKTTTTQQLVKHSHYQPQ